MKCYDKVSISPGQALEALVNVSPCWINCVTLKKDGQRPQDTHSQNWQMSDLNVVVLPQDLRSVPDLCRLLCALIHSLLFFDPFFANKTAIDAVPI